MLKDDVIFYVYILTNKNHTVLYVGMTNNLKIRLKQHQSRVTKSFTKRYNLDKLVYFETTRYVNNAIKKEKQIKKWNRQWKINLINDINPDWDDLSSRL
ncbi:GIY-YIG nuclease family protein [Aquimarina sp. U1-2]|uniref:GIY-YIG nuclease family protein n=1 Tax=Aquimarina sp. U1-2 TaxID=2823141 RepID=UPI001AECED3E|nr:GIY-YIG nuclease family protein [Aquimarina sp. U1-2]MBP2830770.1 GIY-YIG nuclease family protein [Aquimarina sp. U1-2]